MYQQLRGTSEKEQEEQYHPQVCRPKDHPKLSLQGRPQKTDPHRSNPKRLRIILFVTIFRLSFI